MIKTPSKSTTWRCFLGSAYRVSTGLPFKQKKNKRSRWSRWDSGMMLFLFVSCFLLDVKEVNIGVKILRCLFEYVLC